MRIQEIGSLYRKMCWREFSGRALRRIFDFAIPQVSYAQVGEDVVVDFLFQGMGVRPTYLDLGTNHPKFGNNTYKFYRQGRQGVLVEADPALIALIRRVRRRDKVLHCGVGVDGEKSKKFYVFGNSAINTFDEAEARERERAGADKIIRVVDVEMLTVNQIIERTFNRAPDFLSIDIEGLDLAVLKTLDFDRYPVSVICSETCRFSEGHIKEKDRSIAVFLAEKGYFAYADTYINTVFVNEKWFHQTQGQGLARTVC